MAKKDLKKFIADNLEKLEKEAESLTVEGIDFEMKVSFTDFMKSTKEAEARARLNGMINVLITMKDQLEHR